MSAYTGLSLHGMESYVEHTLAAWLRFVSAGQWWAGNMGVSGPLAIVSIVAGALALVMPFSIVLLRVRTHREMQKLREELAAQLARAEAAKSADAMKTEFLGSLSHQIRTPLNAIMGFTELALKTDLAPQLREYLDTVRTSADWLTYAINDVSEFSQLEAGSLKLEDVPFSLSECIRSAMNMVEQEAGAKKLITACNLDPQLPKTVRGDPTRLRHVLSNVLDTAVRSTTAGGVILSAALEPSAAEQVMVRVTVTDTGMGIPPSKQALIFEPFHGQAGANPKSKATVLGLPISRRVLELMGGAITVQSQLGAGSTFEFTVPFRKEKAEESKVVANAAKSEAAPHAAEPETPVRALEHVGPQQASILVVDDDAVGRRLLTKVFESAGHRVWVAANGQEALQYAHTEAFDLIFMDVEMPDLDGLEVTREIRKTEAPGLRVPIYALTAHTSPAHEKKCLDAGMDGFLTKPIAVDELVKLASKIAPGGAGDEQAIVGIDENACTPASLDEPELNPVEETVPYTRPRHAGADPTYDKVDLSAIWKNSSDAAVADSYAPQQASRVTALTYSEQALYRDADEDRTSVCAIAESESAYEDSEQEDLIASDRMSVPRGLALLQSAAELMEGSRPVPTEFTGPKAATTTGDPFEQARKALYNSRFDVRVIHNNGDPSDRNLI